MGSIIEVLQAWAYLLPGRRRVWTNGIALCLSNDDVISYRIMSSSFKAFLSAKDIEEAKQKRQGCGKPFNYLLLINYYYDNINTTGDVDLRAVIVIIITEVTL